MVTFKQRGAPVTNKTVHELTCCFPFQQGALLSPAAVPLVTFHSVFFTHNSLHIQEKVRRSQFNLKTSVSQTRRKSFFNRVSCRKLNGTNSLEFPMLRGQLAGLVICFRGDRPLESHRLRCH